MNSYENLSTKELDNIERNLLKQIEKVRNERKLKVKDSDSTTSSHFKISLFSSKMEDKTEKKEEKEKVEKKVKPEKKVKEVKEKSSDKDDKPHAIKSTISSMKEVLDYHHIDYPSNAKKDDLTKLLLKNSLYREAEKKESNKKNDK